MVDDNRNCLKPSLDRFGELCIQQLLLYQMNRINIIIIVPVVSLIYTWIDFNRSTGPVNQTFAGLTISTLSQRLDTMV
eukprot:snap_masked-scaffold_14-processed-gene-7.37-mRNA-1 protein AED:1.00 eAED:1.00 QI:0/0/0/0/1/1/2/0/77